MPLEFGGGGASHAEVGRLLRELGRRDPSTAVAFSMHCHLVAAQVWRHRHGMDASALFRKVVDDRAVLISTGASDWVASSGSARRVEGGYRVSARKSPASGCEAGHVLVTSIRWDDAPDGPKVLHCAVPFGAEGVRIERTWDTLGLRATGSHTVVLDDVFVPDAAVSLIRPADEWHPVWNVVIGAAMPLILVGLPRDRRCRGRAGAGRRRPASRAPHVPAARRDDQRPHDRGRRRRGGVPGRRRPQVPEHRRSREPHARPQDGGDRRPDRDGASRDRGRRAVSGTPGAPTSSGSIATSTAASSTRSRARRQTTFTGRVALGLSPVE